MAHRYLLFYKPFDVLCQFTNPDGLACKTLKDFIDVPNVYSVGRLDRDSEGLLLLTDHGAMKHRLTHPQFQHPRTYWVQVERCPDEASLQQLRDGVVIKGGYQTRPAQVTLFTSEPTLAPRMPPIRFRKTVPTAWLSLTLTEGRNRQVRRMTAAVGHPTLRLVRVGMGEADSDDSLNGDYLSPDAKLSSDAQNSERSPAGLIRLGDLQPGDWRELSLMEVEQLSRIWATQPGTVSNVRARKRRPTPAPATNSRDRSRSHKETPLGRKGRGRRSKRG